MATRPRTPEHFPKMKERGIRRKFDRAWAALVATDWGAVYATVADYYQSIYTDVVRPMLAHIEEGMNQSLAQMACEHEDVMEINGGTRCVDCEIVIVDLGDGKHLSINTDALLTSMNTDPKAGQR